MTSIDIYGILESKPHNPHYLKRYWKFISSCKNQIIDSSAVYTESHHIYPKAKDLFPEYKSFKEFEWNEIKLTDRQHYIAHWILWKTYGGSQTFAFFAMSNNQTPSQLQREIKRINGKTYEKLKESFKKDYSLKTKGKACYYNETGEVVFVSTKDEKVLNGTYKSLTLGRKMPPRKLESLKKLGNSIREYK